MISTDRNQVRRFNATDAGDLYEYLSLQMVYAFEPGEPVTLEQAAQLVQERAITDNFWAIELKSTGKMVGHLFPLCPSLAPAPRAGVRLGVR
jgi:ribosomal-protein-alanine N-acetyltransferase